MDRKEDNKAYKSEEKDTNNNKESSFKVTKSNSRMQIF